MCEGMETPEGRELALADLRTVRLGRPLLFFDRLDSTSTYAAELGRSGWPEGTAVLAATQTAGRGRRGRVWFSPQGGGVWLSVLLRPPVPAGEAPRMSLAAAVATAAAIRRVSGLGCDLKWPNDLLLDGRKVAGILTEAFAACDHAAFWVVGVGINLAVPESQWPPDLRAKATSLAAAGRQVHAHDLVGALLESLEAAYFGLLGGEWDELRAAWIAGSSMMGRKVMVRGAGGTALGVAVDLGPLGELVLELEDGTRLAVTSGEISISC